MRVDPWADVRFGSGTDIEARLFDVRFTSEADINERDQHVRLVPKADIGIAESVFNYRGMPFTSGVNRLKKRALSSRKRIVR
jgi:hypothetical protein